MVLFHRLIRAAGGPMCYTSMSAAMVEDRTALEFPSQGAATVALCEPYGILCCLASGPGGYPLRVMIDTGTDPAAIDARLARRLALPTGGSGVGQGAASDSVAFTETTLPWLRLGDPHVSGGQLLTIRDLYAPALDLSSLPFAVDVVLGYSVLRQVALRVDFQRRLLTLTHPDIGPQAPGRGGARMPLSFFEHFPALNNLEVDGVVIAQATIDTGSNATITVGPGLAARLGLQPGNTGVSLAQGTGFGGGGDVIRRRFHQARLGPFVLADVELDTHLAWAGDLGRAERANIGTRLLSRFAVVAIDYERREAVFDPLDAP